MRQMQDFFRLYFNNLIINLSLYINDLRARAGATLSP